jgi:hypothetical protein
MQPPDIERNVVDATRDQPPLPTRASALVAACEAGWNALQAQHPGIPDAVIVLGTGVEGGRLVKLGHWWGGQWVVGEGTRGEVLLAGEALHLPPEAVFEVLAHEAAHGLNAARGIKDTSRGGRYHNALFKETAESLGLVVGRADPHGWARTELGDAARERYADVIGAIGAEMRLARGVPARRDREVGIDEDGSGSGKGAGPGNGQTRPAHGSAECGCGRRLRIGRSALEVAPVTCGRCGVDFRPSREPERRPPVEVVEIESAPDRETTAQPGFPTANGHGPAASVVENSFIERRRRALEAEGGGADPFREGLLYLDEFEAALLELLVHDDDPETRRMLEVFRARRPDVVTWLDDLTTADVLTLPTATGRSRAPDRQPGAEAPTRVDPEPLDIDLRTVELPLPGGPDGIPVPRGTHPEPPSPEVGW